MKPVHVFFFRGLSTYGHDNAKWSVFDMGPIYKHLSRELTRREIHFHPLVGLGAGSLPEVADRAQKLIENHPVWRESSEPVHFFGHSAGGLAARLVLEKMRDQERILSCLTVATPNQGAGLAQVILDIPTKYRGSYIILNSFGYKTDDHRQKFFAELTHDGLKEVFKTSFNDSRFASIVCHSPRGEWCAPLRAFYQIKAFSDFRIPSDGVVERDTQALGSVIAELNIDHIRQVGLFDDGKRFKQLCDVIANHFKRI